MKAIYVVGQAKAGTTIIHKNIELMIQGELSNNIKEPMYHIRETLSNCNKSCQMVSRSQMMTDKASYLANCELGSSFLDSSTAYLPYSIESIPSIKRLALELGSEVYIVICLRSFQSRIISQYKQMVRNGVEQLTFVDALNHEAKRAEFGLHPFYGYSRYSLVYDDVIRFLNEFENVMLINFDDINRDLGNVCKDLSDFIKETFNPKKIINQKFNSTKKYSQNKVVYSLYELYKNTVRNRVGHLLPYSIRKRLYQRVSQLMYADKEQHFIIPGELKARLEREDEKLLKFQKLYK